MKFFGCIVFLLVGMACAQLVQKKAPTAADSVDLGNKKGPIVYADPKENEKSAIKNATAEMDSRKFSNDSTVGTAIGVGAEFVGDMMKGMLSPNSPETDAVELERSRR
jgi:F0F1-type ATP synthase assembly protein I